tara:strand:- start:13222 stop:14115 length:894 start_codon:yes stop_codon:yes gene_type:complete
MKSISEVKLRKYIIDFSGQPNSATSGSEVQGVYIDLVYEGGEKVTTCLQCWEGLGDPSLSESVDALMLSDRTNPLVDKALHWAELQLSISRKEMQVAAEAMAKKSHQLLLSSESWEPENLGTVVKLKVGADIETDMELARKLVATKNDVSLRLDFNQSLSLDQFKGFLVQFSDIVSNVDFFEDPVPYDAEVWRSIRNEMSIRLCLDMGSYELLNGKEIDPESIDVLCCKPARNPVGPMVQWSCENQVPLLFTHYMDSELGQRLAAYEAFKAIEEFGPIDIVHGLRPHCGSLREVGEF